MGTLDVLPFPRPLSLRPALHDLHRKVGQSVNIETKGDFLAK
jgi:hypothetical protein